MSTRSENRSPAARSARRPGAGTHTVGRTAPSRSRRHNAKGWSSASRFCSSSNCRSWAGTPTPQVTLRSPRPSTRAKGVVISVAGSSAPSRTIRACWSGPQTTSVTSSSGRPWKPLTRNETRASVRGVAVTSSTGWGRPMSRLSSTSSKPSACAVSRNVVSSTARTRSTTTRLRSAVAHTSRASTAFPETSQHSPSATGGDQLPSSRRTDSSNRPSPPSGQDRGTMRAECQSDSTVVGAPGRASAGGRGSTMRRVLGVGEAAASFTRRSSIVAVLATAATPTWFPWRRVGSSVVSTCWPSTDTARRGPSTRTSSRWKAPRLSPCRVSASTVSWPSSRRSRPT